MLGILLIWIFISFILMMIIIPSYNKLNNVGISALIIICFPSIIIFTSIIYIGTLLKYLFFKREL